MDVFYMLLSPLWLVGPRVGVTDVCVANGACCVACDVVAMTPFVA